MIHSLEVRFRDIEDNEYSFQFGTHFKFNKERGYLKVNQQEAGIKKAKQAIEEILKDLFQKELQVKNEET